MVYTHEILHCICFGASDFAVMWYKKRESNGLRVTSKTILSKPVSAPGLTCFSLWLVSDINSITYGLHLWSKTSYVQKNNNCSPLGTYAFLLLDFGRDDEWSLRTAVKSQEPVTITRCSIQTQYVNAIHTLSLSVPLGILNISLYFRECICPLRPPDHRTAWAKGFICDYCQFETALSLSLRDYLENILIISCKITTLMILLETPNYELLGKKCFFRAEATDTPETTLHFL